MIKIKYTKTATFIFPLLGVPRVFFSCNIKYPNGNIKYNTRFLNAYLRDDNIIHYRDNDYVFLLLRNYRDKEFDNFYSELISFPNYVDNYEKDEFLVAIFTIPDETRNDYLLLLNGEYSKLSTEGKKLIMMHHFYHSKSLTIPLILNKSSSLKDLWESKINASIGDQEVWSRLLIEKETLTPEIMQNHTFVKLKDKIKIPNTENV